MSEWKNLRIKDIAKCIGSGATPKSTNMQYYENGEFSWINTGDLTNDVVYKCSQCITQAALNDFPNLRFYPKDTILVAMYGATIGKVGLLNMKSTVNQACCAIVPNYNVINPKFGLYYLVNYKDRLVGSSCGSTQPNVSQDKVQRVPIVLPSIADQSRIVSYLDTKTSTIDSRISVLEQKRDAYGRLKKSIINDAVTHGLNPKVKMKDSGVDWIGEIPEHWERRRLKDFAILYGGLTGKSGDDFRCDDEEATKPFIPFTNILNNIRIDFCNFKRVVMSDDEIQNQVKENDLLFLMSSEDYESIAKSSVVVGNPGEVYLNSFCRGLRIKDKEVLPEFVNYQLQASKYRDALRFEARGFTRINIMGGKVASMFVSLPPCQEQQEIVVYLDDKLSKVDYAITLLNAQIEKFKLLKRSLINEVITGHRAV